ncbi:MAG: Ni/Fe-hydrogenase, b-type cytochrome subunit [Bifidobacteriaceae bacterium]|nr:Ni/Fe-hydrogenase, b-type cytochrome subunit [Bifidobacteriaceae bacterium]
MTATHAVSGAATPATLTIGGAFTAGRINEGHVIALAAAAPVGSIDPVDVALNDLVHAEWPDLATPPIDPRDADPPTRERRHGVRLVRGFPLTDEGTADLVVMRGSMESVMAQTTISRGDRSNVRRNAAWARRHGWRPLAIATASLAPDGTIGPFALQGFVEVGVGKPTRDPDHWSANWVRLSVWSASLRLQHWLNVAAVFVLSCTGYIIMDPFFGPEAHAGAEAGFQMGVVRFIHVTVGFVWLLLGASRVVSAFVSRDKHLRWTEWWPLKRKQDVRNLGRVMQYYAFIKTESPLFVAHNPLQHLTYAGVYVACGVQMITGFSLYGLYHQTSPFWALVSTPVHWLGIPGIRLIHAMMMFGLWAFVIVHVYLAVRADSLERHGGISSMINGGVWLRRGAKPVDAPEIG